MLSNSPRFDAVLFDLDGTLVDSETTAIDVFHEEGTALGLSFSREEAFRAFRGQPMSLETAVRRM
jgi:beta-phosphoglucomutase-like phosphatase (HAD superfamily)